MAYNLWFAWNAEAVEVFQRVDTRLWDETRHNPVLQLSRLHPDRLAELAQDDAFLAFMDQVYETFHRYLDEPYSNSGQFKRPESLIAYFSAEYGLTDCLPFYHGGLGVLAGDHLKSASDLNIPMVAVGLLYQFGAHRQMLTLQGEQKEYIPEMDFYHMPLRLRKDPDGAPLTVSLRFKDIDATAQIWQLDVGRLHLFLLDTNLPQNPSHIRAITGAMYAQDREMRLKQEMLLGIGGMRALRALRLKPTVYHMNEGHSAFAGLERIRQLREEYSIPFNVALFLVLASNCFTTHTPVPAGIDTFEPSLVVDYFADYVTSLGIDMPTLLGLGRFDPTDASEPFCMNILAMKLAGFVNAVSNLHREVSQRLWHRLWPGLPVEDVPIAAVTNGIHVPSWVPRDWRILFDRYLGAHWPEDPDNQKIWHRIIEIPDLELWGTHERRRQRLITFCRRRLHEQLRRRGASSAEIANAKNVLDPDALTIVWAKRMAAYKRPTLLFKDLDRLEQLFKQSARPVQLIIAGKAHPSDLDAKRLIRDIISIAREERFRRHIVFIEDYDMEAARYLVEGADVWLNTPRRPNEACGTSGMKAIVNGALHVSTLDGWWAEAYTPDVGWTIGTDEEYSDISYQDEIDSKALLNLLEQEVIPLFYGRGPDGLPGDWIRMMKNSMHDLAPRFAAARMMEDYVSTFYIEAERYALQLGESNLAAAKELAEWYRKVEENWSQVAVIDVIQENGLELQAGDQLRINAEVRLGKLRPDDVKVEVYFGRLTSRNTLDNRQFVTMEPDRSQGPDHIFRAVLACRDTGKYGYRIKVSPRHANLMPTHYSLGMLVTWG
jgi:starch phosphorylase